MNKSIKATLTRVNNISENDFKSMTLEEINSIKVLSDKLSELYKNHVKALYEKCGMIEQASSIDGKVWRLNKAADSAPSEDFKAWSAMSDTQKALARTNGMVKMTNGKSGALKLTLVKSR